MDGLRPCVFEARHLPRSGTPLPRPEPTPVRHQSYENQQPRQEGNTGRPLAGETENEGRHLPPVVDLRPEVRHGLSVPTGKPVGMAASGHPLSPARVRAMPERFVWFESPKKPVYQEGGASIAARNRLQRCTEATRRAFKGKGIGKGRARRKNGSVSLWQGLQDLPR